MKQVIILTLAVLPLYAQVPPQASPESEQNVVPEQTSEQPAATQISENVPVQVETVLAETGETLTPEPDVVSGAQAVPEIQAITETSESVAPAQVEPAEVESGAWRKPVIMPEGITTDPQDNRGNWYDKRQILSQARTVYEQIRERIAKVEQQQQGFLTKQRTLDKDIAALYLNLGFEQGELDETYTRLVNELSSERVSQGQLTEEERKLLAEVEEKKKVLQMLRDDVATLQELTAAIDKAVSTMLEQIELCRSYEQKAWENYDKIDNVLNEKIAQQLLLEMQSFSDHIAAIDAYMRGKLISYVDQTAATIRNYMQKITKDVDDLKVLGVTLSRKIAEQEKAAAEAHKQAEELRKQHEKAQQLLPAPSKSWLATIGSYVVAGWHALTSGISSVYERVAGSSESAVAVRPKQATTESIATHT